MKITGYTLIALPILALLASYPQVPALTQYIGVVGVSLLISGMIICGIELIDSHNVHR